MDPVDEPATADVTDAAPQATDAPTTAKSQIRGSSLLLIGRAITMAVNFVVQVVIVRYLTKAEYGAFAYALSIVDIGTMIATLGMDRAITRYLPIDEEAGRYDRLFGTLGFSFGVVSGLGLAVVVAVIGFQALLPGGLIGDQQVAELLLILILLSPIQALDAVFTGLLSVFASPRSIFIRRFLLAPGLKLAVIGLLVATQAGIAFLAWGYVIAGALGILLYVVLLARLFHQRGLWARLRPRDLDFPIREIMLFAIPLLTTDLVYVVMNTSDAIFLGIFRGTADVAAFRVVIPAAGLNQLVFSSFTLLFVPAVARLYAREHHEGVADLYWQTAIWMAVISFPLFAATFSLAGEVTRILYGPRYAGSALYLAMLSFGYYVNTALGFNGVTLRVYGALRPVVLLNVGAAALNVILNIVLIPTLGPLGAAIGTTTALVVHNVFKQIALYRVTGISPFDPQYLRVYVVIGIASLALLALSVVSELDWWWLAIIAGLVSAAVFLFTRSELRLAETFPELRRIPLAGWLLGPDEPQAGDPPRPGTVA